MKSWRTAALISSSAAALTLFGYVAARAADGPAAKATSNAVMKSFIGVFKVVSLIPPRYRVSAK